MAKRKSKGNDEEQGLMGNIFSKLGLGTVLGGLLTYTGNNIIEKEQADSAATLEKQREIKGAKQIAAKDRYEAYEQDLAAPHSSTVSRWGGPLGQAVLFVLDAFSQSKMGSAFKDVIQAFVNKTHADLANSTQFLKDQQSTFTDRMNKNVDHILDATSTVRQSAKGLRGGNEKDTPDPSTQLNSAANARQEAAQTVISLDERDLGKPVAEQKLSIMAHMPSGTSPG